MISLNETLEYAAEIPFKLPQTSNPLLGLTGWAFTLGEVQVRLPGSLVWTNVAVNKIVEKGYGRYAARLTAAQCVTSGTAYLRASVAGAQPCFAAEMIGTLGGDIGENGDGYIPFFLPQDVDPIYGAPITGYDWSEAGTYITTTPRVRICLPDDVYEDALVADISEVGFGGYALRILNSAGQTAKRGKAYIYAEVPGAQPFEGFVTILGVGISIPVEPPPPTPIPSPITPTSAAYRDHVALAISRLPEQFKRVLTV